MQSNCFPLIPPSGALVLDRRRPERELEAHGVHEELEPRPDPREQLRGAPDLAERFRQPRAPYFLDNKRQLWPRFPQNALTGALDAVAAIG